jgi:hypothetical protein
MDVSVRDDQSTFAGVAAPPPPPPPAFFAGPCALGLTGPLMDGPSPEGDELLPQPVNATVRAKPDSRQMMRRVIVVKNLLQAIVPE